MDFDVDVYSASINLFLYTKLSDKEKDILENLSKLAAKLKKQIKIVREYPME